MSFSGLFWAHAQRGAAASMPPAAADPNSMLRLLIPDIVVLPFCSAAWFASTFNGAGGKPGDKVLLRDEGENDHRQDDQHAGCREPAPVYTGIARIERRHHYRQCLRRIVGQHSREQ